jgi:hypothetical protein
MSEISVFISYSHDSDAHRERVLGFSERLRADGIPTVLDRYIEKGSPPEGWPRWMWRELDAATHVLCVCTETYRKRFLGLEILGKGKGVDWEGSLMTQALYDARNTSNKFIPVLFDRDDESSIPEPLKARAYYVLDSEASYQALYDTILNQDGVKAGDIGPQKQKRRPTGRPSRFGAEDGGTGQQMLDEPALPRVDWNSTSNDSGRTVSLVWNVPYPRNHQFAGRADIIARLAGELRSGTAAAVTQAIAGLGGIGKTQLALEYCYRHRDSYKIIWWIRAENMETRLTDLITLGQRLALPDVDNADESTAVRRVIDWLDRTPGWLLVFDNVEDPSHLSELLPTSGCGHILITSRYASWGVKAKTVTLDVWNAEEASNYLLMRTAQAATPENKAAATELADALGRLPLAIEQAAAYIDDSQMGLIEYTRLFSKQKLRLLQGGHSHQKKDEHTVATVWEISLRRVENSSPGAVALLKLCALPKTMLVLFVLGCVIFAVLA